MYAFCLMCARFIPGMYDTIVCMHACGHACLQVRKYERIHALRHNLYKCQVKDAPVPIAGEEEEDGDGDGDEIEFDAFMKELSTWTAESEPCQPAGLVSGAWAAGNLVADLEKQSMRTEAESIFMSKFFLGGMDPSEAPQVSMTKKPEHKGNGASCAALSATGAVENTVRCFGDWDCPACGNLVFASRRLCTWKFPGGLMCGETKPAKTKTTAQVIGVVSECVYINICVYLSISTYIFIACQD